MIRNGLAVVYVIVFIDVMSFGLLIPVLPFYAEKLGAGGLGVGAIIGSFSAAQFVGAGLLGRLSDRIGRRPVLLVALAGTAATLIPIAFADSLLWLVVLRGANGLFAGSISTAQAYIADVTPPEERATHMGRSGAAMGLGFVFGPAIGGWLAPFGFTASALVAAAITAVALVVGVFALRESRKPERPVEGDSEFDVPHLVETLRTPAITLLLTAAFLHMFAFTSLHATYALLGLKLYGMTEQSLGSILAMVGLVGIIVQGGAVGRLSARYGEKWVAVAGAVIMGGGLAVIPWAPTIAASAFLMGVMALGNGLVMPALAASTSRHTDPSHQGAILGLSQATQAAARGIGPLALGMMYDFSIFYPYVLAGLILVGTALLLTWVPRPKAFPRPPGP